MSILWKILILAVVIAAGLAVVVKMQSAEKPIAVPGPVEEARYLDAIAPPDPDAPIWSRRDPTTADATAAEGPGVQRDVPVPASMPTATNAPQYAVPPVRSVLATQTGVPSTSPEAIPSEPQAAVEQPAAPKIVGSSPEMEALSQQVDQAPPVPESTVPPVSDTEGEATGMAEQPAAGSGAPGGPLAVHRVGQGDSLYKLAGKYYGDSKRWKVILDANPSLQGGLRDMRVGTELIIPALPQANP